MITANSLTGKQPYGRCYPIRLNRTRELHNRGSEAAPEGGGLGKLACRDDFQYLGFPLLSLSLQKPSPTVTEDKFRVGTEGLLPGINL